LKTKKHYAEKLKRVLEKPLEKGHKRLIFIIPFFFITSGKTRVS